MYLTKNAKISVQSKIGEINHFVVWAGKARLRMVVQQPEFAEKNAFGGKRDKETTISKLAISLKSVPRKENLKTVP